MKNYSIDRIEGNIAVCEGDDLSIINIPVDKLPESVKEGDIITEKDGTYIINREETTKRKEEAKRLQARMFR